VEGVTDLDLTRYVRTPAGVKRFHKPIGAPIGGGGARPVEKVTLAGQNSAVAFERAVRGESYSPSSYAPSKSGLPPLGGRPRTNHVYPQAAGIAGAPVRTSKPTPAQMAAGARPTPKSPAVPKAVATDVANFWNHHMSQEDKEGLSTDLGLDPSFAGKSIRELRKTITDKKTDPAKREAMKKELAKRIALAKQVSNESKSWTSNLADRLEAKPAEADFAPIIGETLAAHPHLGPLAHIWDRLRLAGYDFKKKLKAGEFTDELPRIVARNAVAILVAGLMLHFGIFIPGLGTNE
jgi:hypothetical protein